MKRSILLALAGVSSLLFLGNSREQLPISVMPSALVTQKALNQTLFMEDGMSIVRHSTARDADFSNVYVVRMPGKRSLPFFVERLGEVLHFEPEKFVVVRVPTDANVAQLSHLMHHENIACGALFKLEGDAIVHDNAVEGAGEPLVPVSEDLALVRQLTSQVSVDRLRGLIQEMSTFETRLESSSMGQSIPDWLINKYQEFAAGRSDVEIEKFNHNSATKQNSVIIRIKGSVYPDELVLLGSHIDSINWEDWTGPSKAPGADDNASGTSTNLEIFRIMMANGFRPQRTIEIHGYAAEERGLVGSQDMARKYKAAGKKVMTMVQHDMNLFKPAGQPDKIWFVTNNSVEAFNNMLGALIDRYVGVAWGKQSLSGGDSDHTSWRRQGYVTSFPFENPGTHNPQIHTDRDTLGNATAMTQVAAFAKTGLAYLVHFAGEGS